MEIKKLVDTINRTYISSDYLRQPDIYYYMDRVIDDINENLQASFPTFSEWEDFVEEYNKQFNYEYVEPENQDVIIDDVEDYSWQNVAAQTYIAHIGASRRSVTFVTQAKYSAPLEDPAHKNYRTLEVQQIILLNGLGYIDVTDVTASYRNTTTYCAPAEGTGNHRYYNGQVINHGMLLIEQPNGAQKTVLIESSNYDSYLQIGGRYGNSFTLPIILEPHNPPQPVPEPRPPRPRPPRPRPPRPRPIPKHKPMPPKFPHVYENQKLWADFGPKDRTIYDAFPDKYLRSVVALGAALYYYEADEEGEQIAMDYQRRYEQQLFYMVRDYQMLVPPMYQNNFGGYIDFSHNREFGPHDLHPRGVVMRGYNSRIL